MRAAQLTIPADAAVDSAGNLFIADWLNHRIRVLIPFTDSGGELAPLLERKFAAFCRSDTYVQEEKVMHSTRMVTCCFCWP